MIIKAVWNGPTPPLNLTIGKTYTLLNTDGLVVDDTGELSGSFDILHRAPQYWTVTSITTVGVVQLYP